MFEERNTRTNLPAQIDISAEGEDAYKFLFIAKGGGSANKTFLYQATPSILSHDRLMDFLREKILTLGTAACPALSPCDRHRRDVGRTDAESGQARLGPLSRRAADRGDRSSARRFAISRWKAEVHRLTQALGVGAQFGGQVFLP